MTGHILTSLLSLHLLPPRSTLFPYTTLFRSVRRRNAGSGLGQVAVAAPEEEERAPVARLGVLDLADRSEEHTSELQSHSDLVCRLLLEKKNTHWGRHSTGAVRSEAYHHPPST